MERAEALDDNAVFFAAAAWSLERLLALRDRDLVERVADEVFARGHDGVRTRDLAICLRAVGTVLFDQGDRERAESVWRELDLLAERTRDSSVAMDALNAAAFLSFADGRLEEALSSSESTQARSRELGIRVQLTQGGVSPVLVAAADYYLGRSVEPLLPLVEGRSRPLQATRSVMLAFLGRFGDARALREAFGDIGSDKDESSWLILINLLHMSVLGADEETAGVLLPRLAPFADRISQADGVSIGRLCGAAAALLGTPNKARSYYMDALDLCEKVRFRPEIALTRLGLAELLLDHYPDERSAAIEHLDFAIAEFRDMKMQPSLERALKHKELLKA